MPLNEISMALTSLKAVVEIAKSILKMSKDSSVKEKIIELQDGILTLQSHIISMQSEYTELVAIKDQLEKKLMEYKNWDKEKSKYKLKEVTPGVFVYVYEEMDKQGESTHYLCANCFSKNEKSILQSRGAVTSFCPRCKTDYHVREITSHPEPPYDPLKFGL